MTADVIQYVSWVAAVIAIFGVVLNNYQRRSCFVVWMVSNTVTAAIHIEANLWGLACRDVVFFALATHGLWVWTRRPRC